MNFGAWVEREDHRLQVVVFFVVVLIIAASFHWVVPSKPRALMFVPVWHVSPAKFGWPPKLCELECPRLPRWAPRIPSRERR